MYVSNAVTDPKQTNKLQARNCSILFHQQPFKLIHFWTSITAVLFCDRNIAGTARVIWIGYISDQEMRGKCSVDYPESISETCIFQCKIDNNREIPKLTNLKPSAAMYLRRMTRSALKVLSTTWRHRDMKLFLFRQIILIDFVCVGTDVCRSNQTRVRLEGGRELSLAMIKGILVTPVTSQDWEPVTLLWQIHGNSLLLCTYSSYEINWMDPGI